MEIRDRVDIKNYIIAIEQNFPINDWKIHGIHIWPIIRMELYFALIYKLEKKSIKLPCATKPRPSIPYTLKNRIKRRINLLSTLLVNKYKIVKRKYNYSKSISKLNHREIIFVGGDVHRTVINKKWVNKFYDPIIQNLKLNSFYSLEYGKIDFSTFSHSENILDFNFFTSTNTNSNSAEINLMGYNDLIEHLQYSLFDNKIPNSLLEQNIVKNIRVFSTAYSTSLEILQKIQPKELYMLWYYGYPGFAIIAAANQLGIKTIEVQHGPQTDVHLAYSNWTKLPVSGYDVLPRHFWCWEVESAKVIESWTNKNSLYTFEIGGNPWHNYIDESFDVKENYILYSLQTSPVNISELFSNEIINAIKSSPVRWFIRFHPRQTNEEITAVQNIIEQNCLTDKVETTKSNSSALPYLIRNCTLHVTHFSGSALEANILKKKSVILNQIGVMSFESILKNNQAIYISYNDPLLAQKLYCYYDEINKKVIS